MTKLFYSFPNYIDRANRIEKIASDFKVGGLKKCGQILEDISNLVLSKNKFSDIRNTVENFFDVFEQEYVAIDDFDPSFKKECFHSLTGIVFWALMPDIRTKEKARALVEIHPLFSALDDGLELLKEVDAMLFVGKDLTKKQMFLSHCLGYLLTVEGFFDESIRLLYALKKIRDDLELDVTLASIEDKRLKDIKDDDVLPEIFFRGWEDSHFRNAIAHARIKYDEKTEKMRFRDYKMNKKKWVKTFDEIFDLQQFLAFRYMLFQVPFLFVYALKALYVRDLVFSENILD